MAKAPKPWKLTEDESFSSFTSWQNNILYVLNQDDSFKRYLTPTSKWNKLTSADPHRGFADDGEDIRTAKRLTAQQKAANLNQMLGLISQWVPHYLSNDIVKNSTDMPSIWQFIRKYYGFQQSESNFMKFSSMTWEDGERPERLYQRILAHLQDNMLTAGCKLKHDGAAVTKDEDMSPTVERLAVLRWMELIHPSLPALVQRTFAYDLQRMTLKDLQPQIVDALDGFLEELRTDEIKASKSNVSTRFRKPVKPWPQSRSTSTSKRPSTPKPECRLCKAEGRRFTQHALSDCDHITRAERRSLIRSSNTTDMEDEEVSQLSAELDECDLDQNDG